MRLSIFRAYRRGWARMAEDTIPPDPTPSYIPPYPSYIPPSPSPSPSPSPPPEPSPSVIPPSPSPSPEPSPSVIPPSPSPIPPEPSYPGSYPEPSHPGSGSGSGNGSGGATGTLYRLYGQSVLDLEYDAVIPYVSIACPECGYSGIWSGEANTTFLCTNPSHGDVQMINFGIHHYECTRCARVFGDGRLCSVLETYCHSGDFCRRSSFYGDPDELNPTFGTAHLPGYSTESCKLHRNEIAQAVFHRVCLNHYLLHNESGTVFEAVDEIFDEKPPSETDSTSTPHSTGKDGTLFWPSGTYQNPPVIGTLPYPSGSMPGSYTGGMGGQVPIIGTISEGTIFYPGHTKKLPGGTVRCPGGTIEYPNSNVLLPSGTVVGPGGSLIYHPPTILPSGTRLWPSGTRQNPSFTPPGVVYPVPGTIFLPGGTVIDPMNPPTSSQGGGDVDQPSPSGGQGGETSGGQGGETQG